MRLGVLRELKNVRNFFDAMEKGIKTRDPKRIYPAYTFLSILVHHMNEGDLTPVNVQFVQELRHYFELLSEGAA